MFNDFMSFLRAGETDELPQAAIAETGYAYVAPAPPRSELRDIEKSFARLFSTGDGPRVLGHLQAMTFQRALGPACSDEQLRYLEGQRAMVAAILRLIDRGRK